MTFPDAVPFPTGPVPPNIDASRDLALLATPSATFGMNPRAMPHANPALLGRSPRIAFPSPTNAPNGFPKKSSTAPPTPLRVSRIPPPANDRGRQIPPDANAVRPR